MKKNRLVGAAIAVALLAGAANAEAKSFKRGVSENSFGLKEEMDVLSPGVSWFYNWANTPNANIADVVGEETMDFIPMIWGSSYNADNIRTYCQSHPEVKYLLGFNEPNFKAQANMTPEVAAEHWPAVQALAKELGLELVGPAVNYSPDGAENEPFTWYANFVKLVGTDAFDYIAIHDYAGGTTNMKDMVDRFYSLYGKRIWVTEFCLNGDKTTDTPLDSQIASMVAQLEYLEKEDKVYRYAWFKAKGSITSGAHYGLIVPQNGYGERELSEAGYVYTYMTDFDATVYHGVDEVVPAKEYIRSSGLMLGKTTDNLNKGVIEITKFESGAYADYQFDIPQAGQYTLSVRVSGQGEPTRFDPTIGVYAVDADGNETSTLCEPAQFSLSGDDEVFQVVKFEMTLPAGKQAIRLRDTNPYQPSGIHLSCLTFANEFSGVASLSSDKNEPVCTVVGDELHIAGTDGGRCEIYDINGRRLIASPVESGVVSIGNLQRGIYVVRITTSMGVATTKIYR